MTIFENQHIYSPKILSVDNIIKGGLYLIHVSPEGYSVIAKRDRYQRLSKGVDFREILSNEARLALYEYVHSYKKYPLILKTDSGSAVVSTAPFASTSTFIVSFIDSEKEHQLLSLFSEEDGAISVICSEDMLNRRVYKRYARLVEDFKTVMNNINATFEYAWFEKYSNSENSVEKLYNIIESAAKLVACPINVSYTGDIICDDRFDQYAFASFLISVFTLCRAHGKTRTANVTLSPHTHGAAVEIAFESLCALPCLQTSEISVFRGFAERNNMLFEYFSDERLLKTKFLPIRIDWSFLELKSNPKFDWER